MKTHALRADGLSACGLAVPAERLVSIRAGDGSIDRKAAGRVTCGLCLRLAAAAGEEPARRDAAAGKPGPGTREAAIGNREPAHDDERIRTIVREEISLGVEQLLRFGEAADVLAVSKKTVRRLVESGEIAVVEVSRGKRRVPATSLEAYIRRQTA